MTSYMLYTLAQLGFAVDILQYGVNVVMDVINLSIEMNESHSNKNAGVNYVDLSEPMYREG